MNQPRSTAGPLAKDGCRSIETESGEAFITEEATSWHAFDPVSIAFSAEEGHPAAAFLRGDAIEVAKAILVAYNVPFCNRVSGEGK